MIYPEWDFKVNDLKFLYELLKYCYLKGYKNIDETVINIEASKNEDWERKYKKIKGYKTIKRLIDKADLDDFSNNYQELKKYNLLRELFRRGYPVENNFDKLKKMDSETIYKFLDYGLIKTFSHHQNIHDSVIIGNDMPEVFERWLKKPDIGIEIPYPLTNELIRGWRLGKLNATGLHSGFGKSRMLCKVAIEIGIKQRIPILIIVNEQDKEEWDAMILTSIVNNYFVKDSKHINETRIVTGQLTKDEIETCRQASEWIKDNSRIYFQEAQVYDYNTLRRVLKIHKLKGCNYFIYDTFKPFRNKDFKGATWEAFVQTSEMLKKLCGNKKKGGLDLGGWITFQLTDESQFDKILNSTSVASGKQIKHNLDFMQMARPLTYDEKQKYKVKVFKPNTPFHGTMQNLDQSKDYYICFFDKNRGGKDKVKTIFEVDKGAVIFNEIGFAVYDKGKV